MFMNFRFSNFNRFRPYEKQTVTGNLTILQEANDSYIVSKNKNTFGVPLAFKYFRKGRRRTLPFLSPLTQLVNNFT